jgi:hypothetical protein
MIKLHKIMEWVGWIFWGTCYGTFVGLTIALFAVVWGTCDGKKLIGGDDQEWHQMLKENREKRSIERAMPVYRKLAEKYGD